MVIPQNRPTRESVSFPSMRLASGRICPEKLILRIDCFRFLSESATILPGRQKLNLNLQTLSE